MVRLVGGKHASFLPYVFASVTAVPTSHMVSSLSSSACVKHPLCWLLYLVNKVFSIALLRKYVKFLVTYASLLQHLRFAFACGSEISMERDLFSLPKFKHRRKIIES